MTLTDFVLLLFLFQRVYTVPADTNPTEEKNLSSILDQGTKTVATAAAETIDNVFKKPVTSLFKIEKGSYCVEVPPECPNNNITFWYYSGNDPYDGTELSVLNPRSFENLEKNDRPWKVIIHGYTMSRHKIPNPELREAYRIQGKSPNIISVDYEPIARDKCYVQAVHNVPTIANCTAQILGELYLRGYMKLEMLHVIGFSLGGQIAGQIHNYMKNGRPPRVTALDPASPLFDGNRNRKISNNAADFVDVIHTNTMSYGMSEPIGDVDFYINGGATQPGCFKSDNESLTTCSHNRSPIVFAESINSDTGFWGLPCNNSLKFYSGRCNTDKENLMIMGEYTPKTARGIYYLQTAKEPPYALGQLTKAFIEL